MDQNSKVGTSLVTIYENATTARDEQSQRVEVSPLMDVQNSNGTCYIR